uniref:Uncharacterized protein n=1 Tax=Mycena chlorophos TaxID=658473 RepID=A0ABQ0MEZ0_MYCCL|nr:predicted protein [Mycena chlorophos]
MRARDTPPRSFLWTGGASVISDVQPLPTTENTPPVPPAALCTIAAQGPVSIYLNSVVRRLASRPTCRSWPQTSDTPTVHQLSLRRIPLPTSISPSCMTL